MLQKTGLILIRAKPWRVRMTIVREMKYQLLFHVSGHSWLPHQESSRMSVIIWIPQSHELVFQWHSWIPLVLKAEPFFMLLFFNGIFHLCHSFCYVDGFCKGVAHHLLFLSYVFAWLYFFIWLRTRWHLFHACSVRLKKLIGGNWVTEQHKQGVSFVIPNHQ